MDGRLVCLFIVDAGGRHEVTSSAEGSCAERRATLDVGQPRESSDPGIHALFWRSGWCGDNASPQSIEAEIRPQPVVVIEPFLDRPVEDFGAFLKVAHR